MKDVGKKLNLPLFEPSQHGVVPEGAANDEHKKPSIDTARARLGGRIGETDVPAIGFAPGVLVTFAADDWSEFGEDAQKVGVVVFTSTTEVHVLLDAVRLRRVAPSDLRVYEGGEVVPELEKIAADARLFGLLVEGQPVRYADDAGSLVDGKVVEKCRWGALVLRTDGAVVAVGFRKLWPSPAGASA